MEILSPAGNFEILKSAVANGADAVYIGGRHFSARKSADNFSNEEISEAVRFAHLHGVKIYTAVNTLVHDNEMKDAFEYIGFLYRTGVDALIVQDLGIVRMIKRFYPDFRIHASTQMTIHSVNGARAAKELGFSRVVLSRELTLKEIKNIHECTDIELEVFVHGALCMSYSGQCLTSSFIGCRSGNRGACAQPCRLPYTLEYDGNRLSHGEKYPLSLKDLCLIEHLGELNDAGVCSFKIEGRMKNKDYVSVVTDMYNKHRGGTEVSEHDIGILRDVFSRSGFTDGYYCGSTGRHMLNYNKNNDDVYERIGGDAAVYAEECGKREPDRLSCSADISIKVGERVRAEFVCGSHTATVYSDITVQKAVNVPISEQRIAEQISKCGNTPFRMNDIAVSADSDASIPISALNTLRRIGLKELEDKICSVNRDEDISGYKLSRHSSNRCVSAAPLYVARVMNIGQAIAALDAGYDSVVVDDSLYAENRGLLQKYGERICVSVPPINRDIIKHEYDISDVRTVYISNLADMSKYKSQTVIADYPMNIFNSEALECVSELGADGACISPELNLRQIKALDSAVYKEVIVYGRIALMTVQNCVVKSVTGKCGCKDDAYFLRDRKGVAFPLYTDKKRCINTIYNSLPVYMADKIDDIADCMNAFKFVFTTESPDDIARVYSDYKNKRKSTGAFTRGHFYRGV